MNTHLVPTHTVLRRNAAWPTSAGSYVAHLEATDQAAGSDAWCQTCGDVADLPTVRVLDAFCDDPSSYDCDVYEAESNNGVFR